MENLNLNKFKEESIKHGFEFDFSEIRITFKSNDSINIYDSYKLFKTSDGVLVCINQDASYIAIGNNNDGWMEIKIRSIPHILNVLKTIYND